MRKLLSEIGAGVESGLDCAEAGGHVTSRSATAVPGTTDAASNQYRLGTSREVQLVELRIHDLVRSISLDRHEAERSVKRSRRGHLGDGAETEVMVAERACVRD